MMTLLRFPDDSYQEVLDAVDAELNAIDARDEIEQLEQHNCVSPSGHLFIGSGCEEVCLHCRRVTWRR